MVCVEEKTLMEQKIDDIVEDMAARLKPDDLEFLRTVVKINLRDYDLVPLKKFLSTEVIDNEWILKRYMLDLATIGRAKTTMKSYYCVVGKFLEDIQKSFRDVKGQDVMDYIVYRQMKDNISDSYKVVIRKYVGAFYKWAYRKQYMDYDVWRELDPIQAPQKKKEKLSEEEVERVRYAVRADKRAHALVELMLSTGMRVGEIVALNIDDFDFARGEVTIKNEKRDGYRIGYLGAAAKLALKEYFEGREAGPAFISQRGCSRISASTMERIAKDAGSRAGVKIKSTTVHVYRKTFASLLYKRTGDLLLVSKMLGHTGTEVTVKYYLVDDLEDMRYKVQRMI